MPQHVQLGRSLRVVQIEPNSDAADLFEQLLKLLGHAVHTFHSSADALANAGAIQPDVIFMPIIIDNMSGIELCKRLRRMIGTRRSRIVALTGLTALGIPDILKEAGFDDYLLKPVDYGALLQTLEAACQNDVGLVH